MEGSIPQPTGTQILPATEQDLPALAELAGVIWRAYYPGIISHEQIDYMLARMYSLDTLREDISRRSVRYERLIVDGKFAGFAGWGPADQAGLFKLHKLYVDPSCHGKGLGTLLLRHCEQAAAALGATQLFLTVNKRNERAIKAYRRSGFQVTSSVIADIGGGFVMDDFVMSKALNYPPDEEH